MGTCLHQMPSMAPSRLSWWEILRHPCLVVRKTSTTPSLSSEALSLYSIVIPSLRQCVHRIVTWAFLVESALYVPQIFSGFPSFPVGLWYLSIYRAQFNIYMYIGRVNLKLIVLEQREITMVHKQALLGPLEISMHALDYSKCQWRCSCTSTRDLS